MDPARWGNRDIHPQTQANSVPATLGRPTCPQGASSSTGGVQHQNWFYTLPSHQEQENSPDVVTCILRIFHLDIYVLL